MSNLDDLVSRVDDDQLPALLVVISARLLRLRANGNGSDPQPDRLLTAIEAAPFVGVSPNWLYDHAEQLPFVVRLPASKPKPGKEPKAAPVRFSANELQKWIRSRSGR